MLHDQVYLCNFFRSIFAWSNCKYTDIFELPPGFTTLNMTLSNVIKYCSFSTYMTQYCNNWDSGLSTYIFVSQLLTILNYNTFILILLPLFLFFFSCNLFLFAQHTPLNSIFLFLFLFFSSYLPSLTSSFSSCISSGISPWAPTISILNTCQFPS